MTKQLITKISKGDCYTPKSLGVSKAMLLIFLILLPPISLAEVQISPSVQISSMNHRVVAADTQYQHQISPNDKYVVYPARVGQSNILHLYSVPIEGGEVVQLTPDVFDVVYDFKISPDGNWVVYRGNNGLNSVSISGGPSTRLDSARPLSTSIAAVKFTPNSQSIVYHELGAIWSIGVDGSNATHLNENQPAVLFDVSVFTISPDSSTVLFPLRDSSNKLHLYSVPVGQSNLTDLIADTSNIESFLFSDFSNLTGYTNDSSRILFSAYTVSGFYKAIFSIPASGGTPIPLSPAPSGEDGGSSSFTLINNDSTVVYPFSDSSVGVNKIISADIISGVTNVLVNAPTGIGHSSILSNQSKLLYSVKEGMSDNEKFFSIPINGSGGPTSLFGGAAIGPAPSGFTLSDDERTLVWSNTESVAGGFKHDISAASINDQSVVLLNSVTDDREFGFYADFRIGGDSSRVVFLNEGSNDTNGYGLFAVPISGGEAKRIESTDFLYEFYSLSSDGEYVVFAARKIGTPNFSIYSARLQNLEIATDDDTCFVVKSESGAIITFCL